MHTFKVGDKVKFIEDYPTNDMRLFGEKSWQVKEVEDVPPNLRDVVGHHQWVQVVGVNAGNISGGWLVPA
jgi:hypothetical protein